MKAEGIDLKCGGGSRAAFSDSGRAAGDSAGHGATFGRPVSGAGAIPRLGEKLEPEQLEHPRTDLVLRGAHRGSVL
jgi:hypothetical protein